MLAQNGARIKVVLGQKERWDYAEFQVECEKAGQPVIPMNEWVQKVGMLTAGILRWPDVEPAQAYQNFVYEMNTLAAQAIHNQRVIQSQRPPSSRGIQPEPSSEEGCTTCGGGIVI